MKDSELQAIKKRYNIVGNCDALNHALDVALQVAPTDLSVLIVGESGVGKEIIPRLIHDQSPRRREKYFAINCGSIPEGTIDSELSSDMSKARLQEQSMTAQDISVPQTKAHSSSTRLENFLCLHKLACYECSKLENISQ